MCFGEIYAAGPEAVTLINRTPDTFEEFFTAQFEQIPGRERKPSDMVRAMIGGLQKVVHKRLYRDEPRVLLDLAPQICGWWLSYPPPPGSLGWPRRRRPKRQQTFEERQVHDTGARRPGAAVARRNRRREGLPRRHRGEIVDRASTSQRTFYENFANKEEALLAALDTGSARMLAKTLPAFRRAQSWQQAVRTAYDEMFSFGPEEPEYSRLGAVEMYAAGKRALETRDAIMEGLEALLAPGYELAPATPAIAAEAIGGRSTPWSTTTSRPAGRRACRSWSRWRPT